MSIRIDNSVYDTVDSFSVIDTFGGVVMSPEYASELSNKGIFAEFCSSVVNWCSYISDDALIVGKFRDEEMSSPRWGFEFDIEVPEFSFYLHEIGINGNTQLTAEFLVLMDAVGMNYADGYNHGQIHLPKKNLRGTKTSKLIARMVKKVSSDSYSFELVGAVDLLNKSYQSYCSDWSANKIKCVVSTRYSDIMMQSCRQAWTSCMNIESGMHGYTPFFSWLAGDAVAYFYTAEARRPFARITLRRNPENGCFWQENRVYSSISLGFHLLRDALSEFLVEKALYTEDCLFDPDFQGYSDSVEGYYPPVYQEEVAEPIEWNDLCSATTSRIVEDWENGLSFE